MPKVGTKEFKIKGQIQKFDLFYSSKDGFYLKGFPSDVYSLTKTRVWFNTESELLEKTEKALYYYHQIIVSDTRVILVSIAAPTGKVMNQNGYGMYQGNQTWIGDFANKIRHISSIEANNAAGFGFLIGYRICLKVESNGFKYYDIRTSYSDPSDTDETLKRETHKNREEIELPWTEENELFFKRLEAKMDGLFEQMVNFFRQPEELLIANMSKFLTGSNLLTDTNNTDGREQ